jgi:hypothetical protein
MRESEPFDKSFYVLSYLGAVILGGNLLDTEQGREKVKEIFKAGLLSAGSFEDLQAIPEFKKAVADYEAGIVTVDPSELSPIDERTV